MGTVLEGGDQWSKMLREGEGLKVCGILYLEYFLSLSWLTTFNMDLADHVRQVSSGGLDSTCILG